MLAARESDGSLGYDDAITYQAWLDLRHESHLPSLMPVSLKDLVSALHHMIARFSVPFANLVVRWMGAKSDAFTWADPFATDVSTESSESKDPESQTERENRTLRASLSGAIVAPKPTRVILNKRRQ